MPEQGEVVFGEAEKKLDEIKGRISDKIEVSAVREFIVGLTIPQETKSGEKIAYSKLCDGLKIVFKQAKRNPDLAREDEDGLARIRLTQQGENMSIVMRDDPSIADLAKLIRTIQILSPASLSNPERMQEINEWFDALRRYSQNLRLAGLAMMWVVDKAMSVRSDEIAKAVEGGLSNEEARKRFSNSEADGLLIDIADTIYDLGQAINIDKRSDGKVEAGMEYQEIVRQEHNNEERLDARLLPGLKFARFGEDEDRQLRGKPGEEFDWMAEMLIRFGKAGQSERVKKMVSRIVDNAISPRADEIKILSEETTDRRDKLPMEMASTLLVRGIEKAYQQLGIPKWIKKFVQANLDDEKTRRDMYRGFKNWLSESNSDVISLYTGKLRKLGDLRQPLKLQTLRKYQEELQTLGLGKEELRRISDWFEDKNFFDENKLDLLKSDMFKTNYDFQTGDRFSWEDTGITSVNEVVEFYRQRSADWDIREEFGEFQKRMLLMIVHEMQIIYPGWSKKLFSPLYEASPSKIIAQEELNCVGRSWLLAEMGVKLGVKIHAALTYRHASVAAKLANGERGIIDPSTYVFGSVPLYHLFTVRDESGQLLQPGEEVVQTYDGDRYLISTPDKGFASALLNNFDFQTFFISHLPVTEEFFDKYAPTALVNLLRNAFFYRNDKLQVETLAEQYKTTPEVIQKLVRRLNFFIPNIDQKVKNPVFASQIRDLYQEVGI